MQTLVRICSHAKNNEEPGQQPSCNAEPTLKHPTLHECWPTAPNQWLHPRSATMHNHQLPHFQMDCIKFTEICHLKLPHPTFVVFVSSCTTPCSHTLMCLACRPVAPVAHLIFSSLTTSLISELVGTLSGRLKGYTMMGSISLRGGDTCIQCNPLFGRTHKCIMTGFGCTVLHHGVPPFEATSSFFELPRCHEPFACSLQSLTRAALICLRMAQDPHRLSFPALLSASQRLMSTHMPLEIH